MRMNEEQNMPDRSTIDGLHGAASYARPGHAHREPETRSTTTRRWRPSLDRHVPDVEGRATRSKDTGRISGKRVFQCTGCGASPVHDPDSM